MAVTTVVKTIGTSSRNFSTLQAWEDAAPANLTTAENSAAGTFTGGAFTQGETLNFVGSGAAGKYLDSDGSTYIVYGLVSGDPAAGDVVTGATSGATCTLSSSTPTGVGVIWQGDCYNDSEFTAGLTLSGSTSSGTAYKFLTAATGQSFQDQSRTTALNYYSQTQGVAVSKTGSYLTTITSAESNVRVSRLQVKSASIHSQSFAATTSAGLLKDCLLTGIPTDAAIAICAHDAGGTCVNVVAYHTGSVGQAFRPRATVTYIGGAAIRATNSSPGGRAFDIGPYGGSSTLTSFAVFGFSQLDDGTHHFAAGSKNNATDLASGLPGSNNQHSVTFNATTPFTQANTTSTDLRAIGGTSLINNGFLDSTNAPNDISGTARSATPTIGHWEVVAAGGRKFYLT